MGLRNPPEGVHDPPEGVCALPAGRGASAGGGRGLLDDARATGGVGVLQRGEALALAVALHVAVALQRGDQCVAAEGGDGVVEARDELLQAQQRAAQGVEGGQVAPHLGEVEAGREGVGILLEDDLGLAAEGLGAIAQLGEAAHLVWGEGDEGLGELLDAGDGRLQLVDLGRTEDERYQVLFHDAILVVGSGMPRRAPVDDKAIRACGRHVICVRARLASGRSPLIQMAPEADKGLAYRVRRAQVSDGFVVLPLEQRPELGFVELFDALDRAPLPGRRVFGSHTPLR